MCLTKEPTDFMVLISFAPKYAVIRKKKSVFRAVHPEFLF